MASVRMADSTRAEFNDAVTEPELRQLAGSPTIKTLQCSAPVTDSVWSLLDRAFFSRRPDVELRVYGHYSLECDLGFARRLKNVRRFAADCLRHATNVSAIAEIPDLDALSLGIFELPDLAVLDRLPTSLSTLRLDATRSKTLRLDPLARLTSLKTLSIEGHNNGIDVLATLRALEEVTLRSITTPDLRYLTPLERLWALDVKLGSIRSFAGIEGKGSIKYLELWQVRALERVDVVASLPGLQNLFLQSLPRVQAMPRLEGCRVLRRVWLENMKGLGGFDAFEFAPALEEFALVDGRRQQPQQLVPLLRNPALRRVKAGFGSARQNRAFAQLRGLYGKEDGEPWPPFEYR